MHYFLVQFKINVPSCRVILPEEVGIKAVPSTAIVSCTVHEAIRRDLSTRGACRTEATLGKSVNLPDCIPLQATVNISVFSGL